MLFPPRRLGKVRTYAAAASLGASVFVPGTALAQSAQTLEELVIVGNRFPVPRSQVATSISVLNTQQIRDYGSFTLTDILRQTAAVGASSNGGVGSLSSLRVRGEQGFRTLAVFDGMRLSDPSGTQVATPLEHLLASQVGRVEVLRGPQGLAYGADAGGVINVSSAPTSRGFSSAIDAQAGARGTQQTGGQFAYGGERADLSLAVSDFSTDGYNSRASDSVQPDDDGYNNQTIHARLGAQLTDTLSLELVHRDTASESQYDGCYLGWNQVNDCLSVYDFSGSRAALTYDGDGISQSLGYAVTKTDRDNLSANQSQFGSAGELARWEYQIGLTALPGFNVIAGIDLEREVNGNDERDNSGLYAEVLSDFSDRWFVTAGLRQDDNDDFGEFTSYRVSSAYLVDMGANLLKLKAAVGRGFRAPSLYEIGYNLGPFASAPAAGLALRAEQSSGIEAGFEFTAQRVAVEVVAFRQDVEEAIDFDLAGYSGYLQFAGSNRSEGIEVIGRAQLSAQLSATANFTLNNTQRANGLQRLRRPKQLYNVGLNYATPSQKLRINAFYRRSQSAIDEVAGTLVALDDFGVLDLNASYMLAEGIEIILRLENAADASYREVADYRSAQRGAFVGVRLSL
ncbi:MAG: TonB-dependent receptor [Gammaproteobacteria bacterium]|nr:TonB-dependent receptor [Gammaproteobacteria bacterium]